MQMRVEGALRVCAPTKHGLRCPAVHDAVVGGSCSKPPTAVPSSSARPLRALYSACLDTFLLSTAVASLRLYHLVLVKIIQV